MQRQSIRMEHSDTIACANVMGQGLRTFFICSLSPDWPNTTSDRRRKQNNSLRLNIAASMRCYSCDEGNVRLDIYLFSLCQPCLHRHHRFGLCWVLLKAVTNAFRTLAAFPCESYMWDMQIQQLVARR
jgi:hypothetical protein